MQRPCHSDRGHGFIWPGNGPQGFFRARWPGPAVERCVLPPKAYGAVFLHAPPAETEDGIAESWNLIRTHHLYQADALQIVSCKAAKAATFVSADPLLLEAAEAEGIAAVDVEDQQQVQDRVLSVQGEPSGDPAERG